MKIAYLILAHNTPGQLQRLISALQSKDATFYIHIDKKSNESFKISQNNNIYIIKKRIPVFWGGYSQVQASLALLQEAKKNGEYDYYILLSGSSYPVKSVQYIKNLLNTYNGYQFIDLYPMPLFDKTFDRVEYAFFEGHQNRLINYFLMKTNYLIRKLNIKRSFPNEYKNMKLYGGGQWWVLTNSCTEYILKYIVENKAFLNFYKYSFCPDEMFFQTIIGNSPFAGKVMNGVMHTDWSGDLKPAIINESHLDLLKNEYISVPFGDNKRFLLFARKFNDESEKIIKKIDTLRT